MKLDKYMLKNIFTIRTFLVLFFDFSAAIIAWYSSYLLRFNFNIPIEHFASMKQGLWQIPSLQIVAFILCGIYAGIWRYSNISNLKDIILATLCSSLVLLVLYLTNHHFDFPRSVIIIDPIIFICISGGMRMIYRTLREYQIYGQFKNKGKPVILIGAGADTPFLLKNLAETHEWHVLAILDDDKTIHNREILGVKVFGDINSLSEAVSFYKARYVIFNLISTSIEHQKILNLSKELDLKVLVMPAIKDLISGGLTFSRIRPVEIEDLLGRNEIDLDNSGLKDLIGGHPVMISGAGGSIGSELCRQIIKFNPSCLICFDISEYALYQLEQELISQDIVIQFIFVVGDVKHKNRLDSILRKYQPKVAFHAAAYKHVPLMENNNVSEAFDNNVLGTYIFAQACKRVRVEKFILISTDKAVNPTNVMGASKRLAELVCQGIQDNNNTMFIVVRFGNVLGSSGSVIPKFHKQIAAGGPITITHPNITRYFMSIPEAAQLVMQAASMGQRGQIFVLDMGKPIRIVDLAKDMIKLSGLDDDKIRIEFTGLRPGEKLYEELLSDNERTLPTSHKKLRVALSKEEVDKVWLEEMLGWLKTIANKEERIVKKELKKWVQEYKNDLD